MTVQWAKSHIDGLQPGKQFRIEATMPGKGFFQVVFENARGSEVFHYSVNIDPPNVEYTGNSGIRNWSHCWHLGRKREWDWAGDTIATSNAVPIRPGQKFTLVLLALTDGIEIMVDGKHVYTANGWSEREMREISQLKVKEAIKVHNVDEQEFTGQKTVENPHIPAKLEFARFGLGRGVGIGTRIRVEGTPVAPRRFQIDLVEGAADGSGEQNIHFHFNPRFAEKQVVRNNLIRGKGWQTEDREGGFPFAFGRQFTVDIVGVLGNRVQVFIDGKHFCDYSPQGGGELSAVDRLEIQGDVTVKSVTMFGGGTFGGQFVDIGQPMMGDMGGQQQSGIGMMQFMAG